MIPAANQTPSAVPHPSTVHETPTGERYLIEDGPHITVRYGTGDNWCLFSSHIYTGENPDGTLFLLRDDGGPNPQIWAWGEYPDHLIPPGSQATPWNTTAPVILKTLSTKQELREKKGNRRVKKVRN